MEFSRRQVIKTLVFGTAFSNVIGRGWTSPLLFSLQATSSNQNGFIRLNLADFPELSTARGSVRISTSALDPRTHKQVGIFPPVIINRGDAGEFYALSAACTHEDCVVGRVDKIANLMTCPCHGSQYRPDGTVVHGPAQQSLRPFASQRSGDVLTVELPDVFYEMTIDKVPNDARLKITFLAFSSIIYEVVFRESLTSAPQKVSFATSETGPLSQTQLAGMDDYASVYVDKPLRFGFFEITMQTRVV